MADRMFGTSEKIVERQKNTPAGAHAGPKRGVPADIAKVVVWLCSAEVSQAISTVMLLPLTMVWISYEAE